MRGPSPRWFDTQRPPTFTTLHDDVEDDVRNTFTFAAPACISMTHAKTCLLCTPPSLHKCAHLRPPCCTDAIRRVSLYELATEPC